MIQGGITMFPYLPSEKIAHPDSLRICYASHVSAFEVLLGRTSGLESKEVK